ncbi:hypothetical protein [Pseudomonas sp. UM16]|uniref:hypothetical protein n=1 Tax=Pseudomonas sp. UM16 TaxID=3158962 RepID=UPI00398FD5FF
MNMNAQLEAYLAANALVTFDPGLAQAERQDALDMLMHAHGFASKSYDSRVHWKSWMDHYRNRLEKHGCQQLSLITEQPRVITSAKELQSIAATVVGDVGTVALANRVTTAIGRVRKSQYADRFFSNGKSGGGLSDFLAVPWEKERSGELLLLVFGMNISLSVETRDFDFWTQTQRDMVLRVVGGLYRFDRGVYANHRESISQSLKSMTLAHVKAFQL